MSLNRDRIKNTRLSSFLMDKDLEDGVKIKKKHLHTRWFPLKQKIGLNLGLPQNLAFLAETD